MVRSFWHFLSKPEITSITASSGSKPMLAVCKNLMFVQVFENITGNNNIMFLDLATKTGKGDRSVV